MKWALMLGVTMLLGACSLRAQFIDSRATPPKEIVEQLWKAATLGELLTDEGWEKASALYIEKARSPRGKVILVMSNDWAVSSWAPKDNPGQIAVDYTAAGKIDSSMRYTLPPKLPYMKTALLYHLALSPTYSTMFFSDGKKITRREERPGPMAWRIEDPEGPPWTTVNTAIRYVLEMRDKTTNPTIKKNADQTLKELLRWH